MLKIKILLRFRILKNFRVIEDEQLEKQEFMFYPKVGKEMNLPQHIVFANNLCPPVAMDGGVNLKEFKITTC